MLIGLLYIFWSLSPFLNWILFFLNYQLVRFFIYFGYKSFIYFAYKSLTVYDLQIFTPILKVVFLHS